MTDLVIADCSEFQGTVNWAAYAAQTPAAIARVCYGTAHLDRQFAANLVGMLAHLQVRGWYQYLVAGQDVTTQARAFATLLGPLQPGEFAIVDIEEGAFTQADFHTWASTVHGLVGGIEGEYSGLAFARTHLLDLAGSPLTWIAAYQAAEPTDAHQLWQYTDRRAFAGIAGTCDASIFHGTVEQLLALINPTTSEEDDMNPIYRVTDGPSKDAEIYDYGFGPVHISGPESLELAAAKVISISGATYASRFKGMQTMTVNLLLIAAVIGSLLPPLIAAVIQSKWSNAVKANASLLLALIAAAVTVLVDHGWQGLNLIVGQQYATAAVPLVLANWATYHGYWTHSPIVAWIDRVTTWTRAHKDAVAELVAAMNALDPADAARVKAAIAAATPTTGSTP